MDKFSIEKLLIDHQNRHSDFQIENFIIGSQVDSWAQYKQCLRELDSRYESIIEHENKKQQLQKIEKNIFWFLSRKRRAYKAGLLIDIRSSQKKIDNIEAEFNCILKIAKKLKKQIGPVSQEFRQQLEAKTWYNKGRKLAAIDLMVYGRVSTQTLEFILSLPRPDATKLLSELKLQTPPMLTE